MTQVKIADRIYYTGDIANLDGWGTVREVEDGSVLLVQDDGRVQHIFPQAIGDKYEGHCNPRFVTEAAYASWKDMR